jgi:hypothetical protein
MSIGLSVRRLIRFLPETSPLVTVSSDPITCIRNRPDALTANLLQRREDRQMAGRTEVDDGPVPQLLAYSESLGLRSLSIVRSSLHR